MINDKSQESVQQSQINLLVKFLELSFQHDITLSLTGLPDVLQVVNTLTPLVHQEWWRLCGGTVCYTNNTMTTRGQRVLYKQYHDNKGALCVIQTIP